jgi:hypothetical protein
LWTAQQIQIDVGVEMPASKCKQLFRRYGEQRFPYLLVCGKLTYEGRICAFGLNIRAAYAYSLRHITALTAEARNQMKVCHARAGCAYDPGGIMGRENWLCQAQPQRIKLCQEVPFHTMERHDYILPLHSAHGSEMTERSQPISICLCLVARMVDSSSKPDLVMAIK